MTDNKPGLHEALNLLVADSVALYLKTKSFHWHVSGPHFRDYHLLFDEQAGQVLAALDPLAERVRKTGGTTLRSVGHAARLQRISDEDSQGLSAAAMIGILKADNDEMLRAMLQARQIADEAGDGATAGLIDQLADAAEERIWFLSQLLESR